MRLLIKKVAGVAIFLVAVNPVVVTAEHESHAPMAVALTIDAQRTVFLWLECEHCPLALLNAVVGLGPGVVPYLDAALLTGPTSARLQQASNALHQEYAKLAQYKSTHPHL